MKRLAKRTAIELIKYFEDIAFEESICGENTVGYITDGSRKIEVLFLSDNIGDYFKFQYPMVGSEYCSKDVERQLTERIVNGKHYILDDNLILSTVVPILDEKFLRQQIKHALDVIWDMYCVAYGCPK